jgi:prepilin-type N-terminal cleavage/methylation domain-containing protein
MKPDARGSKRIPTDRTATSTSKTAGFSLLEMLLVLAVLGILSAISVFNYNNYARSVRMKEVSNRVAQLFQDTSARAINKGTAIKIDFSLNQAAGADMTISGDGPGIETISLENDAEITSVQSTAAGAQTSVTFNARGQMKTGSTLVVKTQLGTQTRTVRLLVTGKTVIQ